MGIEGKIGICHLLRTLGTMRRGGPLCRSFWRLHHRSSFLKRRFIGNSSLNRRSSGSILRWVLVVTAKETKTKTSHKSKERERVKDKNLSQKLMSLGGRKAPHPHGEQKAPRQ
jgi:hypothetical protein